MFWRGGQKYRINPQERNDGLHYKENIKWEKGIKLPTS